MNKYAQFSIIPILPPWRRKLQEALLTVQERLLIISPYIKDDIITMCKEALCSRANTANPLKVRVITRAISEDFMSGSSDVLALQHLLDWPTNIPKCVVEIRIINNVHAKVWICDEHIALIGSGNATPSGLDRNLEYGLAVSDPPLVSQILNDWELWWDQATPISSEQLLQIQDWINKIVDNGCIKEIEVERLNRIKIVMNQIGEAPNLNFATFIAKNGGAIYAPSISDKPFTDNKSSFYLQAQVLNSIGELPENQTDTMLERVIGSPQANATSSRIENWPEISQDPPWDIVINPKSTPDEIFFALLHHSSEITRNDSFTSIGYGLITQAGKRADKVTRVNVMPPETVGVPMEQLWQAVIWTIPIVESIHHPEHTQQFKGLFKIESSAPYKRKKVFRCMWIDENRTSCAVVIQCRRNTQPTWTVTLNEENAMKLIFGLNTAVTSRWTSTKFDVDFLLQRDKDMLDFYYPSVYHSTEKAKNIGLFTIPCYLSSKAKAASLMALPSSQVTIKNIDLKEAFTKLIDSITEREYSFAIEAIIDRTTKNLVLILSSQFTNAGFSFKIPIVDQSVDNPSLSIRLDYRSMHHILFYSPYENAQWRIHFSENPKSVYFVPKTQIIEDQVFLTYHELKNLASS